MIMEISETIKAIREELQMTQTDFAEAIHVSFSTVNRWENNKVIPNRMARALILDLCEKRKVNTALIEKMRLYK
jgi:putative transcriptional regulator